MGDHSLLNGRHSDRSFTNKWEIDHYFNCTIIIPGQTTAPLYLTYCWSLIPRQFVSLFSPDKTTGSLFPDKTNGSLFPTKTTGSLSPDKTTGPLSPYRILVPTYQDTYTSRYWSLIHRKSTGPLSIDTLLVPYSPYRLLWFLIRY